jgi:hypothetical protein
MICPYCKLPGHERKTSKECLMGKKYLEQEQKKRDLEDEVKKQGT